MGYTDHAGTRGVERFMKHYFLVAKDVGDLTRIFCALLEVEQKGKPPAVVAALGQARRRARRLRASTAAGSTSPSDDLFSDDPVTLLRLFHVAAGARARHPPARAARSSRNRLRLIDAELRDDPEANRLFLEILTSTKDPEIALRRMNEAGVFGRFIPDFGRVVAQMQYDMYHHLHGRRAHALRDRHPAPDRDRAS